MHATDLHLKSTGIEIPRNPNKNGRSTKNEISFVTTCQVPVSLQRDVWLTRQNRRSRLIVCCCLSSDRRQNIQVRVSKLATQRSAETNKQNRIHSLRSLCRLPSQNIRRVIYGIYSLWVSLDIGGAKAGQ